jgi:hypothetical protein
MSKQSNLQRFLFADSEERTESGPDQDGKEQRALLGVFFGTVTHFFGSFQSIFKGITDPREPNRITYSVPALCTAGVLMYLAQTRSKEAGNLPVALQ